jgi:hypothetical protein
MLLKSGEQDLDKLQVFPLEHTEEFGLVPETFEHPVCFFYGTPPP